MPALKTFTKFITGGALAGVAVREVKKLMKPKVPDQMDVTASPTPAQTVGDPTSTAAQNQGRAALISTSPSGVLGTDPTGRRKLLS